MRLSITIYLIIAGIVSSCQFSEKKLPKKVIENFQSRFPDAKMIKWEKEKKIYEVEFTLNDIEVSALYDKKGHLLEVETEISPGELPPSVLSSIAKDFPDFRIAEADKIESGQSLIYEVEIRKEEQEKVIYFDPEGKILKIKEDA